MNLPFSGRRYYLKFGLDRDPFPRNSPQQKVFLTHDMIRCLDQIKVAVESSDQLIVVASPPGSGKSVLSHYLGFIKSANWFVGLVEANRELDRETLAHQIICQHFPERRFARSQAKFLLKEFLQLFHRNSRTPVVIIDDAHKLPLETLKFILEIAALRQQEAQYRFVLFGNPGMDEKLDDPNLGERTPARFHHFRIPSLSLEQTRKYIEYRLLQCGECLEDPFTPDRVREIHLESAGLPGDIHAPAKRIMQEHPVRGSQKRLLIQTAATASVCLLVFTGVYSAMNDDYTSKTNSLVNSRHNVAEVIPVNLPGSGTLIRRAGNKRPVPVEKAMVNPAIPVVKTEPEKQVNMPVVAKTPAQGFFAKLFGKDADSEDVEMRQEHKYGDRLQVVTSLDRQLSLRLSDIIEK